MAGNLLLLLVMNAFLAVVMYSIGDRVLSLGGGALFGALVGALVVGAAVGVHYLWEQRPLSLWAINSVYNVINFPDWRRDHRRVGAVSGAGPQMPTLSRRYRSLG